jgi:hypothetical protein
MVLLSEIVELSPASVPGTGEAHAPVDAPERQVNAVTVVGFVSLITGPKQVACAAAPIVFWQLSAVTITLLQSQSAAHAVSEVVHCARKQENADASISSTRTLPTLDVQASAATSAAASSPAASALESGDAAASEAASGVVVGGEPLLDELHPKPTAPAPTIEAVAKPIKYRDVRILLFLRSKVRIIASPACARQAQRGRKSLTNTFL